MLVAAWWGCAGPYQITLGYCTKHSAAMLGFTEYENCCNIYMLKNAVLSDQRMEKKWMHIEHIAMVSRVTMGRIVRLFIRTLNWFGQV